MSLIFLDGFVKPLLIGTATGIACAEFSGLGRGYDGFTPRYFRGAGRGRAGQHRLPGRRSTCSPSSATTRSVVILSIVWGLLILGILILRMRNVLHVGLMEAALERSARAGGVGADGELAVLRPVRDAAAGARRLLQRLRHRRPGPGQGRTRHGGRRPRVRQRAGPADRSSPATGRPTAGQPGARQPEDATSRRPRPPTTAGLSARRRGPTPPASDADAENRFYDDEEGRA